MRNNSPENWKQKYLASLESQEQNERHLAQADHLLRRVIARVSLAADGIDAELSDQLDRLRVLARNNKGYDELGRQLDVVSETIKRLDARRASGDKKELDAGKFLYALIDLLDIPRGLAKNARSLQKRLKEGKSGNDPEQLGREFVEFIEEAFRWLKEDGLRETASPPVSASDRTKAGDGESALKTEPEQQDPIDWKKRYILDFISEVFRGDLRTAAVEDLENYARAASSTLELELATKQVADAFSRALVNGRQNREPPDAGVYIDSENRDGDMATALPAGRYLGEPERNLLADLLDLLIVREEDEAKLECVRKRLSESGRQEESFDTLKMVVDLVAQSYRYLEYERQELERFLLHLTGHLSEIDQSLQGAQLHSHDSHRRSQRLDRAVRKQIRGIENTIDENTEIDRLKAAVKERLSNIYAHLEQHMREEEKKRNLYEQRLSQLKSRLDETRVEANRLKDRLKEEHQQATRDTLTGISNRLAYEERLAHEYARWHRYKTPLSLLVGDVDHFKLLNDAHGHRAGDKALRLIAGVLRENMRETDFIGRYGGEEFVGLLPGTDLKEAIEVSEKLRKAIEKAQFHYHGKRVPITISFGVASFQEQDDPESVFQRADEALYDAKEQGRNKSVSKCA